MKNIKAKFKINPFTYLLILSALWTGFIKNISLILTIVIVHELGHVLWIKHYEYGIDSCEIFPFGGITKVDKPLNTPLKKEIKIALGGVFAQILLAILYYILAKNGNIKDTTYYLFKQYNQTIMIFNLLPIIPLDGSILMHSLLEYFFSYKKASTIYYISSLISLCIFITIHTLKSLNNYMILSFLLFKMYEAWKKRKHLLNRFYLERYLHEYPYEKIESHNQADITKLKKDTLHFFWYQDRYLHEKEILKQHYLPKNPQNRPTTKLTDKRMFDKLNMF